jgi:hypothetical protein
MKKVEARNNFENGAKPKSNKSRKIKNRIMNKKNKIAKISILLMGAVFLFSSCATLFTGTKDRISFNSNPSGATIYIDGVEQCETPCTLNVTRSINDTDLEFKLDGYETRLITLSKEFNVVSIINLGNLLGWGIDAISGAVMKYDRKTYDIKLDSKNTSMITPTKINIDTQKNTVELYVTE